MEAAMSMQPTRSVGETSRWGPAAGVGFAVLFLFAFLAPPSPPKANAPAAAWQAHIAVSANRIWLLIDAGAAITAGILFVAFMACLRDHQLLDRRVARSALDLGCGLLFVMS